MTEVSKIDDRIEVLRDWIVRAAESLLMFYNPNRGVFWRDSMQVGNDDLRMYPTSTNRSFLALCDYLRFLEEEKMYDEKSAAQEKTRGDHVAGILQHVSKMYFGRILQDQIDASELPDDLQRLQAEGRLNSDPSLSGEVPEGGEVVLDGLQVIRWSSTIQWNTFTDGFVLSAVGHLGSLSRMLKWRRKELHIDIAKIRNKVERVARLRLQELNDYAGGSKFGSEDEFHDLVTLHVVRGLDTFYEDQPEKMEAVGRNVRRRVKEEVLRLLAYQAAEVSSHFDATELAFCISLLNRFPTPEADLLTHCAITDIAKAQASDGAWPTTRLITSEGQGLVHAPSYEVALALTQLLIRKISKGDLGFYDTLEDPLERAFNLVKSNFDTVVLDEASLDSGRATGASGAYARTISGWSNDRIQQHNIVESWITSVVLTLLINYRDALLNLRQALILEKYHSRIYNNSSLLEMMPWPDMLPMMRTKKQVDVGCIDEISDPTHGASLTKAVKALFVEPVADNPIHKPGHGIEHSRAGVSLILYGPPGTRKTTLVAKVAEALHWPQLVLSPPYFLRNGGLEGFDACAEEIFADLLRLRRVVVLFDECEEFFKNRQLSHSQGSDNQYDPTRRTTGAFITAGMLPRLQKLRDQEWVIFMLATNLKNLDDLDDAVKRPGRFDFAEELCHPVLEAQQRHVQRRLRGDERLCKIINSILEELDHEPNYRMAKGDRTSFTAIDRAIDRFSNEVDEEENPEKLSSSIREFIRRLAKGEPPSLTDTLFGH